MLLMKENLKYKNFMEIKNEIINFIEKTKCCSLLTHAISCAPSEFKNIIDFGDKSIPYLIEILKAGEGNFFICQILTQITKNENNCLYKIGKTNFLASDVQKSISNWIKWYDSEFKNIK